MCGIAGIVPAKVAPPSRRLLLEMAGELAHRGPDGVGLYRDDAFGMVNTRLAIIDLAGGDQPLSNEDGRLWVMQNGEIYNYVELMAELERLGHRFRTRSDTEVLVHAFEQWGPACLDRLNGEFAFAVWDRRARSLFLARDRFGIRPLYLAHYGGDLVFASEIKALLRHPRAVRRLDPVALVDTFTLWTSLPDRSAFEGVEELPPGCTLTLVAGGRPRVERWWDVPFGSSGGDREAPVEDLAEELRHLLSEATRLRLRADVPVGVYLSGGLDSSGTAALAKRHAPRELHAFGIAFTDARFDERSHQDAMAEALDVTLHRVEVGGGDVAALFPDVVRHAERPMLRTAPAPLMRLSAEVRRAGLKVVLTGEGADEIFGGYEIFQEAAIRRFWARRPESTMRPALLTRLYPYFARELRSGGGFLTEFYREGLTQLDDPLYSHRPRMRSTARNLRFLHQDVLATAAAAGSPAERLEARLPEGFGSFGPLGRAQYLEIHTFMNGFLLHAQGDRMLMANSVEGRFPFLDVDVVTFAARLPERLRMRDLREKYLLRKALSPILPERVAKRPKRPYRAPILDSFFGEGAPDFVAELVSPERLERIGVIAAPLAERLVAKARRTAGTAAGLGESDEMGLVGIVSLALLHGSFVEAPELAAPAVPTREVTWSAASPDPASPEAVHGPRGPG